MEILEGIYQNGVVTIQSQDRVKVMILFPQRYYLDQDGIPSGFDLSFPESGIAENGRIPIKNSGSYQTGSYQVNVLIQPVEPEAPNPSQ